MKRTVKIVAMTVLLCILFAGCDAWMGGEYLSVTPHEARSEPYTDRVIEVNSYTQLRNAITNLVRTGAEDGVISISAFNRGTIHFYVDTAITNVIENTAFGAYAVEKITYEIGTNRGNSVVACKIHYRSGHQLPNKIVRVENIQHFHDLITAALDSAEESVLVYMEQYEKLDVEATITSYAEQYPDRVIENPEVIVEQYPEKGAERIVLIRFKYQTDPLLMHQKRSVIEEAFRSAELCIGDTGDTLGVYEQLYLFLMGRTEYKEFSSSMPAYDILVQGFGDSKSFAIVYARMCERLGLECKVIHGNRDGKPWSWNVLQYRDKEYHIDLLRCYQNQEFCINRAEELDGYTWENKN